MSKIYQQSQLQPGCLKVIMQLRPMLIEYRIDRFKLDYDLFKTDKVRGVYLLQFQIFIAQSQ